MVYAVIPMLLGIFFGGKILARLDQQTFMIISYVLLFLSGVFLLK